MTNGITIFAEKLWLADGWKENVAISVNAAGDVTALSERSSYEPALMARLPGPAIPGMPNLHSHAHQRAMAGLSEHRSSSEGSHDSFWTWRDVMHRFAEIVTPEILEIVATQLYVEMVKAGYTSVCEFHYMHHGPEGAPYSDPSEMSMALIRAATRAGIGITLLPVLYETGGYADKKPNAGQARFISSPDQLLEIITSVEKVHASDPQVRVGFAPHSPRHVTVASVQTIIDNIAADAPIHIHVAEQKRDVDESLEYTGSRQVDWTLDHFDVNGQWCLVHATHLSDNEVKRLAMSGAIAGLCPTTEANLGDGLFQLTNYLSHGGKFGVGSDSHISVNMIEELRWLEYGQRLISNHRNVAASGKGGSTGVRLYNDAVLGGAQVSGRRLGFLEVGKRADFVVLNTNHPALIGRDEDKLIDAMIFAASSSPISEVWIGGKRQVAEGRHVREQDTLDMFSGIMRGLDI